MAHKPKSQPTQQTRPRGKDAEGKPAKPITIPVPKWREVMRDLEKVAKPSERREGRRKPAK